MHHNESGMPSHSIHAPILGYGTGIGGDVSLLAASESGLISETGLS